jgi:hypothetical protein
MSCQCQIMLPYNNEILHYILLKIQNAVFDKKLNISLANIELDMWSLHHGSVIYHTAPLVKWFLAKKKYQHWNSMELAWFGFNHLAHVPEIKNLLERDRTIRKGKLFPAMFSGIDTEMCVWSQHMRGERRWWHPLKQGFSKCGTHTTSGMPTTVQWYMRLVRRNQTINIINKTQDTHTPHAHVQTISSCHQNIVLFEKKGDNYFPYSSSTKKWWKYCWQHCVTVHEIIIGGTLTVWEPLH